MPDQQKYINKIQGDRVLVIGGSSGIGFAVAEACIESGCVVMITGSSSGSADKALQRLHASYPSAKDRVSAFSCALGDEATLESNTEKLFKEVSSSGKLDHIVFTAGDTISPRYLDDMSVDTIKQAGLIRFFAPFLVAKYARACLNPGPKSSYTITSGSVARKPMPGWSIMSAFAAGHEGMARGLSFEMKPLRVNVIAPGAVDTEFWKMSEEEKAKLFEVLDAKTTTGRVARVEDVAETFIGVLKDQNCAGMTITTNSGAYLI